MRRLWTITRADGGFQGAHSYLFGKDGGLRSSLAVTIDGNPCILPSFARQVAVVVGVDEPLYVGQRTFCIMI